MVCVPFRKWGAHVGIYFIRAPASRNFAFPVNLSVPIAPFSFVGSFPFGYVGVPSPPEQRRAERYNDSILTERPLLWRIRCLVIPTFHVS